MTYILFLYTVVAVARGGGVHDLEQDWRPIGEFKTLSACQAASQHLNIGKRSMCVPTAPKDTK